MTFLSLDFRGSIIYSYLSNVIIKITYLVKFHFNENAYGLRHWLKMTFLSLEGQLYSHF